MRELGTLRPGYFADAKFRDGNDAHRHAPPPSVASQAPQQALASSRTRRM
jgi:hypothetical protein